MISIKYFDKFSAKNNNIAIFITKLTELRSISLPFELSLDLNDKSVSSTFNSQKYLELLYFNQKLKINYKIIIKKVDLAEKTYLNSGSSITELFDYKLVKNLTVLFSRNIIIKNIISEIILGYLIKSYSFDKYLTKKNSNIENIFLKKVNSKNIKKINYNINLLKAINFTKDLVSEPANILNPINYANRCLNLKIKGLKIKVLDLKNLKSIGMNALIGVAQGSVNDPRVVVFEWNLKKNKKPVVLVGKGVTFDTGGISIKPSSGMEEMIMDMGGSAVVVGSMINAALNNSKKSIVGIIGLVENMPDGNAQRPGDIVKSLSGQTIEILNTDAEGRLVLADLLTYIYKKYTPSNIIDFATLTGAIMIALGTHRAGLFSNNDRLSKKIELAGDLTGEKVWRLPIGPEYDSEINSLRADMKNIGSSRYGGSIQAAQFIYRFVKKETPWAHIDIAGVTWSNSTNRNNINKSGATGFGVRLIDELIKGI